MDIATGGTLVAILNYKDALKFDLHSGDRVVVKDGRGSITCILDISESNKAVPQGKVGLFEEVLERLGVQEGSTVTLTPTGKPESIHHIRRKLLGNELSAREFQHIVHDITTDQLSDVEKTYFVSACFTNGLNIRETVDLTKAIVKSGDKLKFKGVTLDKHCVGGVPGNRTTMLVIPIVAAAGFTIPKTSSRAITSPAGTADTMEVLAKVEMSEQKIKDVVRKTGACIIHGGAMNLAPADDKLIKVRNPLSLDPLGMMVASVMAKKYSVTANHILIDIPVGKGTKSPTKREGRKLKKTFQIVGKKLGMNVKVVLTDGTQPIGYGIGPVLEAEDVMSVLRNESDCPPDLKEKALYMAGLLLQMAGGLSLRHARRKANELLESGKALEKMNQIIAAQGKQQKFSRGKFHADVLSSSSGVVRSIDNGVIAKIARLAGAPDDKAAGLRIQYKVGQRLPARSVLYTIYAESRFKLEQALEFAKKEKGYILNEK